MRSRKLMLVSIVAVLLASAWLATASAPAMAQGSASLREDIPQKVDDRQDPATKMQRKLHKKAMEAKLHGKAWGKTHEVAKGQYVELERESEDPIWTVIGEFGDFAHNSIAEPDRNVDNTTIWTDDFDRDYYLDLLFAEGKGVNSMRNYYIEQSSNRYTVNGDVTDWTLAPGPACSYDDDLGGLAVWQFLIDTTTDWYNQQVAAGATDAEIDAYLSQFDIWDRYDWDNDGNFDEPDGYIDHAQFVHAGEGNEAGGGALGDCAIWSHSWYAYYHMQGITGPSPDFLEGGIQIGNTSFWVNKYTIQPENGGVGVFAHEYGHDLGLPDLYDYTGTNSTGFWTLMSSGSWLSQSDEDIGSAPNHMGVWEKFQLGWLNYEVAFAGAKSEHKMGPAETNTKQAQGLFVVLPPKDVPEIIGDPYSGSYFYYSGAGNNLDNWMSMPFTLAAGSSLTAMANVQIELDWDYAYLVVSTDGGATWESVDTNLSTATDPNGQNFGFGITGLSGGWVPLTADLSAYTGDVLLGFRYWTDGYVTEPGFMIDDIQVSGHPFDDAETDAGWTYDGFRRTTGLEHAYYSNYYVAEFRQYRGYDKGLANAYNFGWWADAVLYNYVEHYPYQDGLLISYWDTSFENNNVGANCAAGRCGGLLLPIDAHPDLMYRGDGGVWNNRVQSFDSTFGLEPTDELTLHWMDGIPSFHPSQPGVRIFDDNNSYYNPSNPLGSVITPMTGTQIRVKSVSAKGAFMQVEVRPSKPKPNPKPMAAPTLGKRR